MTNEKVLFVLDIDKIQDYIFATNKLKTIIGASWILDHINASLTGETLKPLEEDPRYGFKKGGVIDDHKFILSGGGNTKLVFEPQKNGETARDLAEGFKARITTAYSQLGVSVTTHIQPMEVSDPTGEAALTAAEHVLAQKKYGKQTRTAIAASPFFKICEACGRAYAEGVRGPTDDKDILCGTCLAKVDKAREDFRLLPGFEFETDAGKMGSSGDMLAVVVMDGNKMSEKIKKLSLVQLKEFSQRTEKIQADAFNECLATYFEEEYEGKKFNSIRPIIMGGDDICFVIDAKSALQFVSDLIIKIEHESKKDDEAKALFSEKGITVSTGILYIKKNYPFNFAHRIAESLLREAKRASRKEEDCSMIDFHVLLTSSGNDIEKTRPREYMVEKDRLLTNKPYKNSEIDSLTKDAGKLKKALASNKIKYLRQVLRLDLEASSREIIKILSGLDKDKAKLFTDILEKHGWKMDDEEIWHTGLLDLVEMTEFVRLSTIVTI